ncbi:hypothetical protein NLY43_13100 [Mesorhizobium sp. C416B]|uniref:hypothetical protein n=1 Tax=unclassified Mesorhizobium TaxID=325217 RepID=UPI0012EC7D1E|nr:MULTISPECIES: hypothetical protein [unclassified Mesorhizobium]WJI65559.1 hypothetical protein NLY43_13100 [Mesorhizobium sp. C416B]
MTAVQAEGKRRFAPHAANKEFVIEIAPKRKYVFPLDVPLSDIQLPFFKSPVGEPAWIKRPRRLGPDTGPERCPDL